MIVTSESYWMAFFNPHHAEHRKARDEMKLYDTEIIIVPEPVIASTIDWLYTEQKPALIEWFIDYLFNTTNVRVFYIGKEELRIISELCMTNYLNFSDACLAYLQKYLNTESTNNYK